MTASQNQCDGCQRGLPLKDGRHEGPGGFWAGDVQVCTADRYEKCPDCKEVETMNLESALAKLRSVRECGPNWDTIIDYDEAAALLTHIAALEQRVEAMERHVVLALASAQGGLVHAQRCYPNLVGDFDLIAVRLNLALDRPKEPR